MPIAFPDHWVGYGLHDFRPIRSTYAQFDLAQCPTVPEVSDSFDWIVPPSEELHTEGMQIEHLTDEEFSSLLSGLQASAPSTVPQSFWRFLGTESLRECPLSPTDCHWELSSEWIALPSLPDDRFVRFMSDSQYCYSWYLRVSADASVTVVACGGIESEDFELASPLIEDCPYMEHPELEKLVLSSIVTVAPSFTTFIYRLWIEGLIWLHRYLKLPLSTAEESYVCQLTSNEGEQSAL
jgi:hypothetical protein